MKPFFVIDLVRLGPVHVSFVRNVELAAFIGSRTGWFLTWDHRWLCGTLRVGSFCLNLDVDAR